MKHGSLVVLLLSFLAAWSAEAASPSPSPAMVPNVQEIAEAYVKLVLAMGQHDPDYVDAYYGPPEWKKQEKKPLDAIARDATRLRDQLTKISKSTDEMEQLRSPVPNKATIRAAGTSSHVERRAFEVR